MLPIAHIVERDILIIDKIKSISYPSVFLKIIPKTLLKKTPTPKKCLTFI